MAGNRFIDRLFPVKYDFYEMLSSQARMNSTGVETLFKWLSEGTAAEEAALIEAVDKADEIRMDMEKRLIQAFSTPFDRGDLYSISIGMDKIIEYAKSTMLSMKAYNVPANDIIIRMADSLKQGAELFTAAIGCLKRNPSKSETSIARIRGTHTVIEQLYRDGMAAEFKGTDPLAAFKQREVYHHIKDASANLEDAVDILHRIVVRLT